MGKIEHVDFSKDGQLDSNDRRRASPAQDRVGFAGLPHKCLAVDVATSSDLR